MELGEILEGTLLGILGAVVLILFMRHYDPKAAHSRRRMVVVWFIPGLALFSLMCWLFDWLRNR
jgi:hypothetical protein